MSSLYNVKPPLATRTEAQATSAPLNPCAPLLRHLDEAIGHLRAEVRALRDEVSTLSRGRRRARDRHAEDAARLLPLIAETWGANRLFATGELIEFAADLDTGPRRELHEALQALGETPQRVGMKLAGMCGPRMEGLELERMGDDRSGALFAVKVTP
jgi:hypothetical protein